MEEDVTARRDDSVSAPRQHGSSHNEEEEEGCELEDKERERAMEKNSLPLSPSRNRESEEIDARDLESDAAVQYGRLHQTPNISTLPHISSETVQRSDCDTSLVCEYPSVDTSTSLLDTDVDDLSLSDIRIATPNKLCNTQRPTSNNFTQETDEFLTGSPIEMHTFPADMGRHQTISANYVLTNVPRIYSPEEDFYGNSVGIYTPEDQIYALLSDSLVRGSSEMQVSQLSSSTRPQSTRNLASPPRSRPSSERRISSRNETPDENINSLTPRSLTPVINQSTSPEIPGNNIPSQGTNDSSTTIRPVSPKILETPVSLAHSPELSRTHYPSQPNESDIGSSPASLPVSATTVRATSTSDSGTSMMSDSPTSYLQRHRFDKPTSTLRAQSQASSRSSSPADMSSSSSSPQQSSNLSSSTPSPENYRRSVGAESLIGLTSSLNAEYSDSHQPSPVESPSLELTNSGRLEYLNTEPPIETTNSHSVTLLHENDLLRQSPLIALDPLRSESPIELRYPHRPSAPLDPYSPSAPLDLPDLLIDSASSHGEVFRRHSVEPSRTFLDTLCAPIIQSSAERSSSLRVPEESRPHTTSELNSSGRRSSLRMLEELRPHSSAGTSGQANEAAAGVSGDDDRPRRKPTWMRDSMRRATPSQLPDPPTASTLPPLATPDTVLDILESSNRRPSSAPGGGASRARRGDFPRRYSSYSATILNSNSVTNLTQAAEPVAVESTSSEEEDDDEEVMTSASEGPGSPTRETVQQGPEDEPEHIPGSPLGQWPHGLSSMLALLGCTLGLFNISRFAVYSVDFGANFVVQFLFLTLLLGIPLYTLSAALGQCLCAGVMDMWRISPIFQGVGIALLVAQALIGVYSIVGISWMFIYFRDSFITKQDRYRWAEPYQPYRQDSGVNGSWKIEETVPDYLNGIVLQRHNLASPEGSFGHLKFQVAFNLAVVWMIVFVSLSKGLKSYGKVVYVFSLVPVFGMLVLCTKMLGLSPGTMQANVFPETVWSEFFLNTRSWVAATTEVFFTWGLLGAATMQIASHNRYRHLLSRDVSLVIVLTTACLVLAAFLANTCVSILNSHGYLYMPSSFEHMTSSGFLHRKSQSLPPYLSGTPVRYMSHTTLIAGTKVIVPRDDSRHHSGYQVLRLATEIVPATLALLGPDAVSPFWAVLFYFVLILFGIAQQLCIWHSVITGIMGINAPSLKAWETTITFFSCAGGFILGLPMTTELGIFVVYFLDYSVGCAWWIMLLYFLKIIAVFVVRGRPYSGETVGTMLFNKDSCLSTWAGPLMIFNWNVVIPIMLIVMCIMVFKSGQFRDLYDWRSVGYEYWPVWTREVGCMLQILPIAIVPLICVVQTFRYLSNGPRDILDRIQLLYRPNMNRPDVISVANSPVNAATQVPPVTTPATTTATSTTVAATATQATVATFEDPPPKYTPPPSYTTATGARIAKLLRQSFRRSMRRLTNVLSDTANNTQPPPPDYAAVLVEINRSLQERDEQDGLAEPSAPSTILTPTLPNRTSSMTAADVAQILRRSFRRTAQRNRDAERLVDGAAPIHSDGGNSSPANTTQTEIKPET